MKWAEQFHIAMQNHNSAILRKMANEAQREEARMCLALLADLVDFQEKKGMLAAWLGMLPGQQKAPIRLGKCLPPAQRGRHTPI